MWMQYLISRDKNVEFNVCTMDSIRLFLLNSCFTIAFSHTLHVNVTLTGDLQKWKPVEIVCGLREFIFITAHYISFCALMLHGSAICVEYPCQTVVTQVSVIAAYSSRYTKIIKNSAYLPCFGCMHNYKQVHVSQFFKINVSYVCTGQNFGNISYDIQRNLILYLFL